MHLEDSALRIGCAGCPANRLAVLALLEGVHDGHRCSFHASAPRVNINVGNCELLVVRITPILTVHHVLDG
jgi:hypothetical protein